MTAEEDRLIAFLVGEINRAPKPVAGRVSFKTRRSRKNRNRKTQVHWSATAPNHPPTTPLASRTRDTIRVREPL